MSSPMSVSRMTSCGAAALRVAAGCGRMIGVGTTATRIAAVKATMLLIFIRIIVAGEEEEGIELSFRRREKPNSRRCWLRRIKAQCSVALLEQARAPQGAVAFFECRLATVLGNHDRF